MGENWKINQATKTQPTNENQTTKNPKNARWCMHAVLVCDPLLHWYLHMCEFLQKKLH